MLTTTALTRTRLLVCLALAVLLGGCAGSVVNMREVPATEAPAGPDAGKAMVVFMRPSTFGFAIQSSVFEVVGDEARLVGIVAAKKKVAYQVEPGERLFMTIGESADYMSADLRAGRTYYALVTPRMGLWKARFSLRPIGAENLGDDEFNEWLSATSWVATTAESDAWASENMESVLSKHREYHPKWMEKDSGERPHLAPGDGQP